MLTVSAYLAQNSTSWETIRIVTPCAFNFSIISANFNLKKLSIPLVGSSIRRIFGSVKRTFAKAVLCCSPPDKSYGWLFKSSVISQISATFLIFSSFFASFEEIISAKSSFTVLCTKRLCGSCGSMAIIPLKSSEDLYLSSLFPSINTFPL